MRLTALLVFLLAGACRADLAPQDRRAAAPVAAVRRLVPACFIPALVRIPVRTLDAAAAYRAYPDVPRKVGWTWEGKFDDAGEGGPRITLVEPQSDAEITLTAIHELGHYVYRRDLTNEQREAWESIWRADKRHRHLCTDYAATDSEEGWCESLSYFYGAAARGLSSAARTYFQQLQTATQIQFAHAHDRP